MKRNNFGYPWGIDPKSDVPIQFQTVFLKYFAPVEFVADQNVSMMTQSSSSELLGKIIDTKGRVSHKTGSMTEGLAVPDFLIGANNRKVVMRDADEMIVEDNYFSANVPEDQAEKYKCGEMVQLQSIPDGPDNFAFLKVTDEFKKACELEGKPLRLEYLLNTTVTQSLASVWDKYGSLLPSTIKIAQHGPSVTEEQNMPSDAGRDRDRVPAVAFKNFPIVASEWITRKRPSKWPPQTVIDEVVQNGHHMVPVGRHHSPTMNQEWRYSFSLAEKLLAESLSKGQRHVYVLLKMMHYFYFSEVKGLPTYYLKTLLFWISERIPQQYFHQNNVAKLVFFLLDELILQLSKRQLFHYFIRSVNLLEHLTHDHAITLCKKIKYVRQNILTCILDIDNSIKFFALSERANLQKAFRDALMALNNKNCNTSFTTVVSNGLFNLLRSYLYVIRSIEDFPEKLQDIKPIQRNVWIKLCYQVISDIGSHLSWCKGSPVTSWIYILSVVNNNPEFIAGIIIHMYCLEGVNVLKKKGVVAVDLDSVTSLKTLVYADIDDGVESVMAHTLSSETTSNVHDIQGNVELLQNIKIISKLLPFPQKELLDNSLLYGNMYHKQIQNIINMFSHK